uniref:Peroxiredoxin-like 2A n=1 Tax=Zooxanthella nutricula TaxID=1333877 RepID=A0A7S2JR47_9DINO
MGEAAPTVPPKAPRATTSLYKVALGGTIAAQGTPVSELWKTGALVVVVRRPGCALCREQAYALSEAFQAVVASQGLPGMPRLVAVVRTSARGEDGSSEVDAFREYFQGDVYVDQFLAFFKALGDRQYTDGVFSQGAARWMLQRMAGMQRVQVSGNFVGGPDTALKFGGCFVFDRDGAVRFAHQEGRSSIDYEALRAALSKV